MYRDPGTELSGGVGRVRPYGMEFKVVREGQKREREVRDLV